MRGIRSTLGLTLVGTALFFGASVARAVDLTGSWTVFAQGGPAFVIDFIQSGQQLSGTFQGQPDPFLGGVNGNDFYVYQFSGLASVLLSGTVRGDGNGFTGTATTCTS